MNITNFTEELETSVLGGLLIEPRLIFDVCTFLQPQHFEESNNKVLYTALLKLASEGRNRDMISVSEEMAKGGKMKKDDAFLYVVEVSTAVNSSVNTLEHANLLVEQNSLKEMISRLEELHKKTIENEITTEDAAANLRNMAERVEVGGKYADLLKTLSHEDIIEIFKRTPERIDTGYTFEGESLSLPKSALTFICAQPSHGKSTMLRNLALRLATNKQEGDVLYFTFEESGEDAFRKFLNTYMDEYLAENNLTALTEYYKGGNGFERGKPDLFDQREREFTSLVNTHRLNIFYKNYDSDELISAIRQYHRERRIKAVFIDYVQKIIKRGTNVGRREAIGEICNDFDALSHDLQIPIVMGAQLSRQVKSPVSEDMAIQNIAEATFIEQTANMVILLWNSSFKPLKDNRYYTPNGELTAEAYKIESKGFSIGMHGKLYAVIAKNRDGKRGVFEVLDIDENRGIISQGENERDYRESVFDPFAEEEDAAPF